MKRFLCGILAALACFCLVACTPSSIDDAKSKMQEAGYTVEAYSNEEAEGKIGGFIATKSTGLLSSESITASLFDTKENATAYYEKVKVIHSDITQDGKWVYWGSEAAVEAFTK
ncbi:MAG: hypothetical protein IJX81_02390 [Clostridia bacterium]|nr:hypothetical protein [Clostridia bacterium]